MSTKSTGLLLLLATLFLSSVTRAEDLELLLDNGLVPITGHRPGDDLWLELRGAAPGASYELRLTGPDGELLTSLDVIADDAGNVASRLLWPSGGVSGCDCAAGGAGAGFKTFEQAEVALGERELGVQVLDAEAVPVAQTLLPVVAGARELIYFSDAEGCPRRIFEPGEPVYLSFLHPDRHLRHRLLFISDSSAWPDDQALADLRGLPEWLTLPVVGVRVTVPVDLAGLAGPGPYFALVRQAGPSALQEPFRFETDVLIPPGLLKGPNGGIVISMDGCLGGPSPQPIDW